MSGQKIRDKQVREFYTHVYKYIEIWIKLSKEFPNLLINSEGSILPVTTTFESEFKSSKEKLSNILDLSSS